MQGLNHGERTHHPFVSLTRGTENTEKRFTTKSTKDTKNTKLQKILSRRPTQTNTDKNIHHGDTGPTEHAKNKDCLKV